MSIVERAIRKLQSQPAATATNAARPASERPIPAEQPQSLRVPPASAAEPATPGAPVRTYSRTVRLDKAALRAAGVLPPEHQERLISNQYRQIKRPLIANAIGRHTTAVANGHLIMVASAMPGEGKTFTSVNLALNMALEKDLEVLLVDADVAKPHISTIFGLTGQPGLLDCLQDESVDVESLIVATDVERLTVLPAGRHTETATELLASSRMEQIVKQVAAAGSNRIALLDSPPLLLTNESRVLAGVVGQVVLVVRAGVTSHQAVLDAISHIEEGKSMGLILNQSELEEGSYYYGSGAYGAASTPSEARELQQS